MKEVCIPEEHHTPLGSDYTTKQTCPQKLQPALHKRPLPVVIPSCYDLMTTLSALNNYEINPRTVESISTSVNGALLCDVFPLVGNAGSKPFERCVRLWSHHSVV